MGENVDVKMQLFPTFDAFGCDMKVEWMLQNNDGTSERIVEYISRGEYTNQHIQLINVYIQLLDYWEKEGNYAQHRLT